MLCAPTAVPAGCSERRDGWVSENAICRAPPAASGESVLLEGVIYAADDPQEQRAPISTPAASSL